MCSANVDIVGVLFLQMNLIRQFEMIKANIHVTNNNIIQKQQTETIIYCTISQMSTLLHKYTHTHLA